MDEEAKAEEEKARWEREEKERRERDEERTRKNREKRNRRRGGGKKDKDRGGDAKEKNEEGDAGVDGVVGETNGVKKKAGGLQIPRRNNQDEDQEGNDFGVAAVVKEVGITIHEDD